MNTLEITKELALKTNYGVNDLSKAIEFHSCGQAIVKKDAKMDIYDLTLFTAERIHSGTSAMEQAGGLLILAESFAPIVTLDSSTGKEISKVRAIDFMKSKLETVLGKDKVIMAFGRIPSIKAAIANNLDPVKLREAKSLLDKFCTLDEKGVYKLPSESDPKKYESVKNVLKALKENAPLSNVLQPLIRAEKDKYDGTPDEFVKRRRKNSVATALVNAANSPAIVDDKPADVNHDASTVNEALTKLNADSRVAVTQCEKAMDAFKGDAKAKRASLFTPENWDLVQKIKSDIDGLVAMIRPLGK